MGLITNEAEAVCDKVPLVPVIIKGYVPEASVPVVAMVSVDVPEPVTEGGLKVAPSALGWPLTLRFTVPAKPFCAPTLTV